MRFVYVAVSAVPYPLIANQFVDGWTIPAIVATTQILVSIIIVRVIMRTIRDEVSDEARGVYVAELRRVRAGRS